MTEDLAAVSAAPAATSSDAGLSKKQMLRLSTARILADAPDLVTLTTRVLEAMKRYKPVVVVGMDPALHWLPPHVSKSEWTAMGNLVVEREAAAGVAGSVAGSVGGERWVSLRLDGSNFSKIVRAMRRRGILEGTGYSHRFAECMRHCLNNLMSKFGGVIGYTQSDEMMVLIPPASVVRGEQQAHPRSGRVVKTTTLAASYVTVRTRLVLACVFTFTVACKESVSSTGCVSITSLLSSLSVIRVICVFPTGNVCTAVGTAGSTIFRHQHQH